MYNFISVYRCVQLFLYRIKAVFQRRHFPYSRCVKCHNNSSFFRKLVWFCLLCSFLSFTSASVNVRVKLYFPCTVSELADLSRGFLWVISRIFDVLQWVARIVFIKGSKWFSRPQRCGEGHGVCSVYKKFIYNVWIHVKCEELDEIMSESPGVEWLPAYSPGPPRHSPLGPIPRFLYEDVQPLSFHQENNNKESELETTNKIKHAKPAYR